MKKILSLVMTFGAIGAYAQLVPSTTPANKNILLEDLTGIHCGYCPDGAKRADEFKAQYPGRVVIIGNHCSGYATPGSNINDKDFRTDNGEMIDNQSLKPGSSVAGYPAGNVSRRTNHQTYDAGFTATSRGYWSSAGATYMNEPSPVNLAVDAYYHAGSQSIVVNVAGYYTSAGSGNDYISVAILQDNLDSYQSGASGYPARVQGSGLYRQMDVLREYLTTSPYGDEVTETAAAQTFYRTYTYDASQPVTHNVGGSGIVSDVTPVITDMKVVVYMTEEMTWSPVITAIEGTITERPVGISEAPSLEGLQIYPNPFAGQATLEFNLEEAQTIEINLFDISGKMVQNTPAQLYSAGNHRLTIEGQDLQNGLYTVNILAEDGIVTRRIVLNR